ncbi:DUF1861 family protein [Anaerocolumna sp. AGMB13025]|uniref:DUF1861 family protein n=1 Tax=Anaerocolumna sp. AGMB13025 TaxID=3039116 RepID=UPI00241F40E9|nr:DUF1861 family protein [Anaerocolumna sp. AGMB13025]WFR56245.1 DUF1861 family protein [Anaerocolumna sp. AGMB13025]
MTIIEQREVFEREKNIYESCKVKFLGVEGFDVYNTSIPFYWEGKRYIYGRIEKRDEWARSWARLFEETGKDEWTLVQNEMIYQLEDPYIAVINGELILGGTHVRKKQGIIDTYYGYFYRGKDIHDLVYFTTGPDYMKDIRLVSLEGGKIGVFSRPRNEEIRTLYGSESIVGFTVINDIQELNAEVINNAEKIDGLFDADEWGGCNQCYYLDSGKIGVIGHKSYKRTDDEGNEILVYVNISFVYDREEKKAFDVKIIGTRDCYPEGPAKLPSLVDCVFTSGIVMREDGKADLYSGVGDTEVGRLVIDYPFKGYGAIVNKQ